MIRVNLVRPRYIGTMGTVRLYTVGRGTYSERTLVEKGHPLPRIRDNEFKRKGERR